MVIKKIGIIANVEKEKSSECALLLRDWAVNRGIEVFLEEGIAGKIGEDSGLDRRQLASRVDLLVVMGGDGTILRTVRFVSEYNIPIVGINLGEFGYLTEVNLNEMFSALELICRGDYQIEKRMMLDITISLGEETVRQQSILNDVVITRGNLSRILDHIHADGLHGVFPLCRRPHRFPRAGFLYHQSHLPPYPDEQADHHPGQCCDQGHPVDKGAGCDAYP
jgi:NAD+ kinase